jgi:hypothetical protein
MKRTAVTLTLVLLIGDASLLSRHSWPQSKQGPHARGGRPEELTVGNRQSTISNQPTPWYDRVLRRVNSSDFDYGAWLEERRVALLSASVRSPQFWYSVGVSSLLALFILAYAKRCSDFHKLAWMCSGWLADFYNETMLCREQRDAAIDRHNRHIEKCNRAVEAEMDGSWKQQQNDELEQWRGRYEQLARLADETAGENKRLALILSEKEQLLSDMSLRLQDLEEKIKAKGYMVGGQTLTINESNKLLVNRINILERQLRDEQTKNKALKSKPASPNQ